MISNYKQLINSPILADLLLLLLLAIIVINYDYSANLAPEALLMVMQLGLLWGFCRIIYWLFPTVPKYITYTIVFIGLLQAVWGLGQLFGYFSLKHALFKTTGSFFNSGPYGGFIALVLPLVLHLWLKDRQKNKAFTAFLLAVGIACLAVFPATMSRTAWIAAVAGCGLVFVFDKGTRITQIRANLRNLRSKSHRKMTVLCIAILCVCCALALHGVFYLKKDSANGRLFMWKITALAIQDAPITGTGLGSFPAAYAAAQMAYFESEKATETEKWVAGSPEYAFNEYLRMFLEQGVLGGVLFLLLTFLIIAKGIRRSPGGAEAQIGAVGSFLALSVFAFASYPYYLWEFSVMWVLLGTICVSRHSRDLCSKNIYAILFLCTLPVVSLSIAKRQIPYFQTAKEWKELQPYFSQKAFRTVVGEYEHLYPMLNHNQRFVFEYATALSETGRYEEANSVLLRGFQISNDPAFYNIKGRNYHEMREYEKAELHYKNAIYLLPERTYPHYLLTLLYADPNNYQPDKMRENAHIVLQKEPKVFSVAITEMRETVKEILIANDKCLIQKNDD
jgi:O-antigen ligase